MSSVTVTAEDYSQLKEKNVIITGGSTGIGEATVRLLHEHGATITLADVNDTAGAAVAASLDRVTYVHCNVSSWDSLTVLFKSALLHGPIDIVFSNAGVSGLGTPLESELSPTGDMLPSTLPGLSINLTAALLITKLALHYFRQQG